ncbi:MAG: cold-shock protein [Gaiellaceae bacterium]
MPHGTIKSFDQAGGHGYILSDDGETLWVHRGSTGEGLQLVPGEPVVFDRQIGGMGPQAVEVVRGDADSVGLAARREAQAGLIAGKVKQGYWVESQTDTEARLIARSRKKWLGLGARLPEKRERAKVDELGRTSIERLPDRRY